MIVFLGLDPRTDSSSWFFGAKLQNLSRVVKTATVFLQSIFLFIPHSWRVSYVIYLFSIDLGFPFVKDRKSVV